MSALFLLPAIAVFAGSGHEVPALFGIRIEFIIFALTLVGVALFHHYTMQVALGGLTVLLIAKFAFDPEFSLGGLMLGNEHHEGEWKTLLNLVGLLLGFGILARHFEDSGLPQILPNILPDDWKGGFVLLAIIMLISSFLDNIAAAMIGGTVALVVFRGKVHIGYIAAIIAASNAGGAGSVLGDTTTTIMWIDGVNPFDVIHAYIASVVAFLVFGFIASRQQQKFQPITKDADPNAKIIPMRLVIVVLILAGAITTNYLMDFPAVGVWVAILIGALLVPTPWHEIKDALPGTIFLTALVTCASLIPVDELPAASWQTALSLGFISSVFDNIPLTKLCLDQGGYDWGVLAYAVGFGGSMLWFGSSAGVAITSKFPEARSVGAYLRHGWHVILGYLAGFMALIFIMGWHPHTPHKKAVETEKHQTTTNNNEHGN